MANITLSVPEWVRKLMKKYSDINWSEVARRAIIKEILRIKAYKEGLNIEEINSLYEIASLEAETSAMKFNEAALQRKLRERERRRMKRLEEVEA